MADQEKDQKTVALGSDLREGLGPCKHGFYCADGTLCVLCVDELRYKCGRYQEALMVYAAMNYPFCEVAKQVLDRAQRKKLTGPAVGRKVSK